MSSGRAATEFSALSPKEIETDFELLVNSNSYLRVKRTERRICRASVSAPNAFGFTEWSQRELRDIDGKPEGGSEQVRANQTPYNSQ